MANSYGYEYNNQTSADEEKIMGYDIYSECN
jgi:hypothetical protein